MKLILCNNCKDVVSLQVKTKRNCKCGLCHAQYEENGLDAWYEGPATPLGFANSSLVMALLKQPQEGMGESFEAFVIPKECPTFTKLTEREPK